MFGGKFEAAGLVRGCVVTLHQLLSIGPTLPPFQPLPMP